MSTVHNRSHHRGGLWAVTAVLGAAIIWGLWWWPLRTVAHAGMGDFGASIAVYLAGIAVLLPLVPWRATPFRHGGAALVFSAVVFGFALAAWNLALLWGTVARVTLLFYLSPVWAVLFSFLFLNQRPDRLRLLAGLLGLLGAAMLLADGLRFNSQSFSALGKGDMMGLAAGLLFALSITGARGLPGQIDGPTQALVALIVATLASTLFGWGHLGGVFDANGSTLLFAFVVGALFLVPGTLMMLHGGNTLDPGRVTLLLLIEVPVAVVSAALIAGETISSKEAVAAVMILIAAVIETRPRPNERAFEKPT